MENRTVSRKDALQELIRVLDIFLNAKFSSEEDKNLIITQVKIAREGYAKAEKIAAIKRIKKKKEKATNWGIQNG